MQTKLRIPESAWVVHDQPCEPDLQILKVRLREYNGAAANTRDGCQLALFLHDDQERLMGGICGRFWGECLEIDTLWVEASWRGQGIGKRLLQTLETEAISRGCCQITLTTFSFQAPAFYQKLGYHVFGLFGGFGNGHQKFYLQKRIESRTELNQAKDRITQ